MVLCFSIITWSNSERWQAGEHIWPAPDLIWKTARSRVGQLLAPMKLPDRMAIGIGWYSPDQYSLLKAFAADPDALDENHEKWLAGAEKLFRELDTRGGMRPVRVPVDVQELLKWCREMGSPLDGSSRAQFIAEKVRIMSLSEEDR
jgi:hypothetical protein